MTECLTWWPAAPHQTSPDCCGAGCWPGGRGSGTGVPAAAASAGPSAQRTSVLAKTEPPGEEKIISGNYSPFHFASLTVIRKPAHSCRTCEFVSYLLAFLDVFLCSFCGLQRRQNVSVQSAVQSQVLQAGRGEDAPPQQDVVQQLHTKQDQTLASESVMLNPNLTMFTEHI